MTGNLKSARGGDEAKRSEPKANDQTPEANAKELEAGWIACRIARMPEHLRGAGVEAKTYNGLLRPAQRAENVAWANMVAYRVVTPAPAALEGSSSSEVYRKAIAACDGEQEHFETWAKANRYEMHEHPLHYLFMDEKTNAARQGWNAALAYVRALHPSSAADAKPVAWAYELARAIKTDGTYTDWGPRQVTLYEPFVPEGSIRNLVALGPLAQPQPIQQAGTEGVREALEQALDRVEYKPGDHPVVPIKHDAFVREVRAILAALKPVSA